MIFDMSDFLIYDRRTRVRQL